MTTSVSTAAESTTSVGSVLMDWWVMSGALVILVYASMTFSVGLSVLVFFSFLVLMLFMLMVDGLVDIDFVEVVLVQMFLLEMEVVDMDLVQMMLVNDMLMLVMLVDHLLGLVMLMDDFLCSVAVGLEVLNGVGWAGNGGVGVVFSNSGGSLRVGILTIDNFNWTASESTATSTTSESATATTTSESSPNGSAATISASSVSNFNGWSTISGG